MSTPKDRARRVAHNLKRLRRIRGIKTVNDLIEMMNAHKIEINPSYMRRLESANAPFGSDMEQRFIQFYRVDISEFYRPVDLTENDKEIESVRSMLMNLNIEKIRRVKKLIPILFEEMDTKEVSRSGRTK